MTYVNGVIVSCTDTSQIFINRHNLGSTITVKTDYNVNMYVDLNTGVDNCLGTKVIKWQSIFRAFEVSTSKIF